MIREIRNFIGLALLFIFVGLTFNNCGNVRLSSSFNSVAVSSAVSPPSYLAAPVTANEQMRFILLVDMSGSMVRNSCPGDIDSALPMGDDDSCDVLASPSDPNMYRLQVVKNWLETIESTMPADA